MAAREMSQRSEPEGYRAEELGERVTGLHDETKWSLLTTEFWAMVLVIVAILIASAVSDISRSAPCGARASSSGQECSQASRRDAQLAGKGPGAEALREGSD